MSEVENAQSVSKQTKHRTKRRVLLLGVPTFAIVVSVAFYMLGGRYAQTDNAYIQSDITSITNQVSGPIRSLEVRENDVVTKGQLLYTIDPDQYEIAVSKAKANLALMRSNVLSQKANYEKKKISLKQAEVKLAFYQREEKRQKDMLQKHFVSNSDYDQAQENVRESELDIAALKEDLNALREMLGGDPSAPVEEHPGYKAMLAALDKAKLDLSHTEIHAPSAGVVSKLPKNGEYMATGATSMMLVNDTSKWVDANFTEKDLTYVKTGEKVEIEVDTYPGMVWKGTVESISPATGSEFSIIPAENATGNWVKVAQRLTVRISIDDASQGPVLRSGMSAEISIDTEHKRRLFGISL